MLLLGNIFTAEMTNVQPNTVYYYQYGSDDVTGWSLIESFLSAPAVGQSKPAYGEKHQLIFYGDMGVGPEQPEGGSTAINVLKDIYERNFTGIVHFGGMNQLP